MKEKQYSPMAIRLVPQFLNHNSIYILMEWIVIMLRVDESANNKKKIDQR